ncbi:MAG TPA: GNAT family N-acetyltransferase [Pseudonocardiaceae bacterium]
MDTSDLTLRALTADDAESYGRLLSRAFLHDPRGGPGVELDRALLAQGRAIGVFDGTRQVGGGGILNLSMTLPGGVLTPFAGVTWVSVASDHRRRGILTRMMRNQLHGLHEQGAEPFAALWASESKIYRRFGYGEASEYTAFELTKGAQFRPGVVLSPDPIRELTKDEARPLLAEIHAKALPSQVGRLSRDAIRWDLLLLDEPEDRDGMTELRFAVHPEGCAVYRVKSGRDDAGPAGILEVLEVIATTGAAHAALWRYLLDMDLVRTVRGRIGSDDPLRQLIAEPQDASWQRWPALWIRLVDLDRALPTRRYSAPLDVVFEVTDEFCPWNAGRWRLTVDASGTAQVTRTDDDPDIATDILDLGAIFLGGTRLSTLARTGRVRELTDGAVAKTTVAFLSDQEPDTVEIF